MISITLTLVGNIKLQHSNSKGQIAESVMYMFIKREVNGSNPGGGQMFLHPPVVREQFPRHKSVYILNCSDCLLLI